MSLTAVAVHVCCIHPPTPREHGRVVHPVLTHCRTLLVPRCMKVVNCYPGVHFHRDSSEQFADEACAVGTETDQSAAGSPVPVPELFVSCSLL